MIVRLFASLVLAWMLGFVWFAAFLPQPAGLAETDGIVVPTGGPGRIERGIALLRDGQSRHLLVSGVDPDVRPREFAAEFDVPRRLMNCCVELGFEAQDTRGNGQEIAAWAEAGGHGSLRLVTSDWHMRRVANELGKALPPGVTVLEDAVVTHPGFGTMFLEYNKWLASLLNRL